MCSSPKINFKEFNPALHPDDVEKILDINNATSQNRSLIIFTFGFENNKLKVIDDNEKPVIMELMTDKSMLPQKNDTEIQIYLR
jgi:hypothetical protein